MNTNTWCPCRQNTSSTATSAAVGGTPAIGSVFGGNGTLSDTYVFRYTPGTDVDNTVFAAGAVLGSTTGFPGQGNVSSGMTGGVSGTYRVYFTTPESTNVSVPSSDFTITQDGDPIVLDDVNLNNLGTGADTDPGPAFVGGANNAWWLLGTVALMGVLYYRAARQEEESFLAGALAEQYRDYQTKTGMFLPRPRRAA